MLFMNSSRLISLLLTLILSLGMTSLTPAQATADVSTVEVISGVVTEYEEGKHLMLDTDALGSVQVNLSDETPLEVDAPLQVGDYVYVSFDGAVTASLPPQIGAQNVVMHRLTGEIVSVDAENNDALIRTAEGQEVLVYLPEAWKGTQLDSPSLTAYFNGAITMSLPGQITAGMIVPGYFVNGVVEEIGEDFILIDADGQKLQVNTDSIPEGLKAEDVIRVRYNGQMTRSIPAQIYALEIIRVSR